MNLQRAVLSTDRQVAVIVAWSVLGVAAGCTVLTPIYYYLITPIGPPVTMLHVYRWMVVAWSIWILSAPLCVLYGEWVALRYRQRRPQFWLLHGFGVILAVGVHGFCFAIASTHLSPYITLVEPTGALVFFSRFIAPVDIAVYAALVAGASRVASSLLSLRTTPEGLLQTATGASLQEAGGNDPVLEATPGPVLVYDPDSLAILGVNEPSVTQYGWSPDEFRRLTLPEICGPGIIPGLIKTLGRTRDLPIWRARSVHRRKDGATFEVELTHHAVVLDGRWARLLLVNDVTAVERAQHALAESEQKFRSVFEGAVVGIFRSTPDGRLTMLNEAGARILGYADPAEAMGRIEDIAHELYVVPEVRDEYLQTIERDGHVSDWCIRLRRRDGGVIWANENARGVFEADGRLAYVEGTFNDITDAVEAREALQNAERRTVELRVQLATAQLRALKLQLKPHFLFNILNTVAMMIRSGDTDKAQRVATLLGDMFRRFLEFEGEDVIPLKQELEALDLYLELEQFRFEDRMHLHRRIDEDVLDINVPALILQPIVENAIKHGVATVSGRCRLDLVAQREADDLLIEVINDSRIVGDRVSEVGHGIGISNTRSRLQETYGGRGAFALVPEGSRMRAVLRIPLDGGTK